MSVDNPYYFYSDNSPRVSQSQTSSPSSSKGFSFFRRRSSSNSSNKSLKSPSKSKPFNSATLGSADVAAFAHYRNENINNKAFLRPINLNLNNSATYSRSVNGHFNGDTTDNPYDSNRHRRRIGSYNECQKSSADDDVFAPSTRATSNINSDSSSGSILPGLRRHSIGTFVNRDKIRCGSFSDEVPKSKAPKPPTTMPNRPRHDRRNGNISSGMDDILIVTSRQSEPAILWANYLKTRFDKITKQRGRQPFNFIHVKIDEERITADIAKRCHSTKLQMVILCSSFMALPHNVLMSQLSAILKPDIVLGILLEVPEERILEIHKNALPSFKKWRRCVVRNQDQSFVGNVLGIATDILGRALCQRPPCTDAVNCISYNKNQCQSEEFTVLPRKVKIGQNKVVAILTEPLQKDDWIRIKIEKAGEVIDIVNFKKRNPYTLQFSIPESCMEVSTMIDIKIEKNSKELGSRPVKCESRLRELEQILRTQDSPMEFMCQSLGFPTSDKSSLDTYLLQTFQKNVPHNFHLLSGSSMKKPGFLPQKESSSEEYPTLLHFAAKWGLDNFAMLLVECPGGDRACENRNCNGKTPADLAESAGFSKLATSLRSFSQMNEFTTMYHYFKGISDSTESNSTKKVVIEQQKIETSTPTKSSPTTKIPPTVATQQMYMEMSGSDQDSGPINAVTNLNYINIENETKDNEIMKNLNAIRIVDDASEIMTNELKILEPAYFESTAINNNKTDEFSQECSNVLENCSGISANSSSNENSMGDYLLQPSNKPVLEKNSLSVVTSSPNDFGDYLTHPSNKPVVFNNETTTSSSDSDYLIQPSNRKVMTDDLNQSHLKFNFKRKDDNGISSSNGSIAAAMKSKYAGTLRRQGSDTSKISVDDELVEIMNDFKNNVFTIQEVEQLVVSWKNRNDVQQSYKDKQDQLQNMRTEYERIQDKIKDKIKRPTPFERVRKLFSRSKSINHENNSHEERLTDEPKSPSQHRPMSSLSLQSISSSSSSSGRMSTGSVCSGASLGDSGTHSDHEDRRHIFANACRIGQPGSLIENYLIPPAPRPIATIDDLNKNKNNCDDGVDEIDSSNANEHYVLFPSNIPVSPISNISHEYMNFSGLNTIEETKESGPDIIIVGPTVQPIKVQKPETIYGPITKNVSDLCSSFKPASVVTPATTNNSSSVVIINDDHCVQFKNKIKKFDSLSKANINEIYRNINELETQTSDEIAKLSKTINECNSNIQIAPDHTSDLNSHEYMNL